MERGNKTNARKKYEKNKREKERPRVSSTGYEWYEYGREWKKRMKIAVVKSTRVAPNAINR